MQDKNTISIFQGSTVEADTVHDFLAQQGIGSLIRNHMQESLDAGWVTADAEHAAEVFVALEDEARAVDLLRNLFSQDTAAPAATGGSTSGATIVVTSENTGRAAETSNVQPSVAQPGAAQPIAARSEATQPSADRPLNLPRIISLPVPQNRPAAPNAAASEGAALNPDTSTPTPPSAPPRF